MDLPLKLDISLQELAMTQVAVNCWQRRKIKKEMRDFFVTHRHCHYTEVENKRREWCAEVVKRFYSDTALPNLIKDKMLHIIISVGERVIEWLLYRDKKWMFKEYFGNIVWNSYGAVDEVKVFETLYANQIITDTFHLYDEACLLCLKNHIEKLQREISEEQRDFIFSELNCQEWLGQRYRFELDNFNIYLLFYWQMADKRSHIFTEDYLPENFEQIYNFSQSASVNHFILCANTGHEIAARFFFKQLTDDEKNQNLVEVASGLIKDRIGDSEDLIWNRDSRSYYHMKYIDILVFLILQMSDSQRKLMKKYALGILQVLLCYWPWQNLFIPMLREFHNHLDWYDYSVLLKSIIERVVDAKEFVSNIHYCKIYEILLLTWNEVPLISKQRLIELFSVFEIFLETINDIPFAKYVVNDPDLIPQREGLLKKIVERFCYMFAAGQCNLVDNILCEVFLYSEQQCVNFKKTYDSFKVCKYIILTNRFDHLNKFLKWQFENAEDFNTFKNHFKLNLCSSILCSLWYHRNSQFCETVSRNLFAYFTYSKNDKKALRDQLVDSDEFGSTLAHFVEGEDGEKLDRFLHCCDFPEEDIDILKLIFPNRNISSREVQ